uniref:NADH-ubiquinone oxidoreductase chain 2 n=1 Tax=Grylloblatta sculleni TaxID=357321 RepID=Q2Q1M1_9NEOP|nr:NADH dehydrogenase subunit 2 [Grylloblatta sculleni]
MFNNPSKYLFLTTLMAGTLISVSSNSWLSIWMGLEINLLSFIPLMSNSKNLFSTESSLKYFLTQALASAVLLFLVISTSVNINILDISYSMPVTMGIMSSLLLKSGGAPLHFWLPGVMEGLNWYNCLILMTWQKIAPMMLMSYCISESLFTSIMIVTSVMVGSVGGLNQTSLRKLLAYSSINHVGWMLAAMITGENLWLLYFLVYSFLNMTITFILNSSQIMHMNQIYSMMNESPITKFMLFSNFMSLGGLPPFLGFMPKWIIIQFMLLNNMIPVIIMMVLMTLLTLYYYLQMAYSATLITHNNPKWNLYPMNNMYMMLSSIFTFISIAGLMLCTVLLNVM